MIDKPKFPLAQAQEIAHEIVCELGGVCERITIAGSVRRRKEQVGDIEIIYIPKLGPGIPPDELLPSMCNLAEQKICRLVMAGLLELRKNVNGSETFGLKNKLVRHCASGIPVDLFSTDSKCWFNYLVCRTGPAAFNISVAQRAREFGWKWHPYDCGFSRLRAGSNVTEWRVIKAEEDLFEFLGWPYRQPWDRAHVEENGPRGKSLRGALTNQAVRAGVVERSTTEEIPQRRPRN